MSETRTPITPYLKGRLRPALYSYFNKKAVDNNTISNVLAKVETLLIEKATQLVNLKYTTEELEVFKKYLHETNTLKIIHQSTKEYFYLQLNKVFMAIPDSLEVADKKEYEYLQKLTMVKERNRYGSTYKLDRRIKELLYYAPDLETIKETFPDFEFDYAAKEPKVKKVSEQFLNSVNNLNKGFISLDELLDE